MRGLCDCTASTLIGTHRVQTQVMVLDESLWLMIF